MGERIFTSAELCKGIEAVGILHIKHEISLFYSISRKPTLKIAMYRRDSIYLVSIEHVFIYRVLTWTYLRLDWMPVNYFELKAISLIL